MPPTTKIINLGSANGGSATSGSGGSGNNSPVWVGYIEFDDETGEAIAADYSGLEVDVTYGLQFGENYKYRGEWKCDMKKVISANHMFSGSANLTSFNGDLSSLTNGTYMFVSCPNLTSFSGDLRSLTNGTSMFSGCSNLTSFNGDLRSLTNGHLMFSGCRLDKESVIRIITCLRERNTCTSSASITIGCDSKYTNDPELLEVLGITTWRNSVTLMGHGGGTWTITLESN